MKTLLFFFLCCFFAFANIHAQEFTKPTMASPEETFYTYLDNKYISDPTQYNGNIKKVVRTFTQYEQGMDPKTIEKVFIYLDKKNTRTKTVKRYYQYGIEDVKEEIDHLETPTATTQQQGDLTIKTITEELLEAIDMTIEQKGDDHYVYQNDLLIAFYNNNDSISYTYDSKKRLITKRCFESFLSDDFEEQEDGSYIQWRSAFTERSLEKLYYKNDLPARKIIYDKFSEVIDIYKKKYTYAQNKSLLKFETEYKRYLYDMYEESVPIDQQEYDTFPKVTTKDSIQIGTFQYSKTNKITSYQRAKGEEKEAYTITYNDNDLMHLVEGTLTFYRKGRLVSLPIEYEYMYDEKGNPKTVLTYYFLGGEKLIDNKVTFEIEYE
ncbi:MAG: hypothetical protein AAF617_03580 [Bacteroidota bacterium]